MYRTIFACFHWYSWHTIRYIDNIFRYYIDNIHHCAGGISRHLECSNRLGYFCIISSKISSPQKAQKLSPCAGTTTPGGSWVVLLHHPEQGPCAKYSEWEFTKGHELEKVWARVPKKTMFLGAGAALPRRYPDSHSNLVCARHFLSFATAHPTL